MIALQLSSVDRSVSWLIPVLEMERVDICEEGSDSKSSVRSMTTTDRGSSRFTFSAEDITRYNEFDSVSPARHMRKVSRSHRKYRRRFRTDDTERDYAALTIDICIDYRVPEIVVEKDGFLRKLKGLIG